MLPEYVKFYYDALPPDHKAIYLQMYEAFKARKNSVDIKVDPKTVSHGDLAYIFKCLHYDTPSFYFVNSSAYRWIERRDGYTFAKDFIYTPEQIARFDKALESGLEAFAKRYIKKGMSDYEKELAIHDYLVGVVSYDYEGLRDSDNHPEIYNTLGALLKKKAVCAGIASAFKLLCDYCHLKCFVVIGTSVDDDGNMGESHAWNMVKLDGKTYHVDATWDIRKQGDIRFCYDYVNLSDTLIKFDHTWDTDIYPKCNHLEYNYYLRNKLYVRRLVDISGYVQRALQNGSGRVIFKFANKMPSDEAIKSELRAGVQAVRAFTGYRYIISRQTHNVYLRLID